MDPFALDARYYAFLTLTIDNFSKVKDTVLSPPRMLRNLPWKIMIMQRWNVDYADRGHKSLGFFLQCNGDSKSSSWSCYAYAYLTIVSQKEGVDHFTRKIQHTFSSKEDDWGFRHFMSWNDVLDPDKGFIKNDTVIFEARVYCQNRKSDVSKNQQKVVDKNLPSQNSSLNNRLKKKQALALAKVKVKHAKSILKPNKKSSDDSPADASTRIRIDWKPVPFCGKEGEWCRWWRIFESVIHKNEAIDEEVRMKALTECLKDDANDVLGDMPRTGENYRKAVAQLHNQYGDARILSQTYYNQLKRVAPANDVLAQRETVTKLRAIVQNLDALREKFPIDDDVITCHIVQKFPNEVLHSALQSLKSSKQDITFQATPAELLGALDDYLQIEEFINTRKMKLEPDSLELVDTVDEHGLED